MTHKPLYQYASEVTTDWKNVYFGAVPYLNAMYALDQITDMHYQDSAVSVVLYFLSNAHAWRGPIARQVKKELRALVNLK